MVKTVFLVLVAFGLFVYFMDDRCGTEKITTMTLDEFSRIW